MKYTANVVNKHAADHTAVMVAEDDADSTVAVAADDSPADTEDYWLDLHSKTKHLHLPSSMHHLNYHLPILNHCFLLDTAAAVAAAVLQAV